MWRYGCGRGGTNCHGCSQRPLGTATSRPRWHLPTRDCRGRGAGQREATAYLAYLGTRAAAGLPARAPSPFAAHLFGLAASELVVLPGAVRERARVGPSLITVSWMPCACPPTQAAREHGRGTWWCIARRRGAAGRCDTGRGTSPGWRIRSRDPPGAGLKALVHVHIWCHGCASDDPLRLVLGRLGSKAHA
jgi:hypothetical protein